MKALKIALAITLAASLSLPAIAGDSVHGKRRIYHWHGYGFLPGYHQPPNPNRVHYGPIDGSYGAPHYYYGGGRYYFGRPGFSNGRWNGGSYGPCWTHTPIGLMWNCG